jgi:hypothetical protein
MVFHTVEKSAAKVPHRGKVFSTLWKNQAQKFHAVEKRGQKVPHNGK